ncbi:tetratricopeptide repeat protein, partial [Bacillus cereus group sp. BC303]|uniref:tetratricopeptide repeat protein n=1 Tax=Bacillus cereus group sp. BC303 TaxID=3445322 RepID=UPI003F1EE3CE
MLAGGQEAGDVYFNLGNAYYKSNNIALAILNYERAVKLNPDNEDYQFNLKLANQRIEDKIDEAPQLFLTEWKNGIAGLMTE